MAVRAPAPHESFMNRAEAVLGVDPRTALDKLRQAQEITAQLREKEARLAAEVAMYEARYSYPSHFEHERKAKLAALVEARRNEAQQQGRKITEGALDSHAHSHPDYRYFLDQAKREREKLEAIRAELIEVRGKIETQVGVEKYYDRQCRMNESLTYAAGREMGLS